MHVFFHTTLLLGVSFLSFTSASALVRRSPDVIKRELAYYEERYINSRSYIHRNETVKLVGCKKMKVAPSELDDFEHHYFTNHHELSDFDWHFYDEANKELRIYFPVENALVQHGGRMIEANHLGEFEMEELDGDYAVLGRYQTDHVHGVDGNIIKDGVIYLAEPVRPHRQLGNVFFYDFGYKDMHDHDHEHQKRCDAIWCTNQGCIKNHGGENCSKKFGIREGRCPFQTSVCMDYNGVGTDCNRAHRVRYFVGSDCSVSVAEGHCWNEMVAAAGEGGM